ncbi:MAG: hypothetical protein ACLUBO_15125 [Coprococcus sp.]
MMAVKIVIPREMARQVDGVIFNPARSSLSCSLSGFRQLERDDLFERLSGAVDCLGDLHAAASVWRASPYGRRWTSWRAPALAEGLAGEDISHTAGSAGEQEHEEILDIHFDWLLFHVDVCHFVDDDGARCRK